MRALKSTFRQLDGILNDLSKETSRSTKSALVDGGFYDSDTDDELGERELQAELDSAMLAPWKKYLPNQQQGSQRRPSGSLSNISRRFLSVRDGEISPFVCFPFPVMLISSAKRCLHQS